MHKNNKKLRIYVDACTVSYIFIPLIPAMADWFC